MSDTTEPRDEAASTNTEPLNDSAEMRDAIRSIEAIGEDRTGAEEAESSSSAAGQDDDSTIDLDEDGS